ncbi:MAG: transcription-repair coupling factor, partial [Caldiserica bacterium]
MARKKQSQNLTKKEFINLLFGEKALNESIGGITRGVLPFLIFFLSQKINKIIFVAEEENEAYEIYEEYINFAKSKNVVFIPKLLKDNREATSRFILSIKKMLESNRFVAFTSKDAASERISIYREKLELAKGKEFSFTRLIKHISNDYERVNFVREKGEFAVRGGIIDIFPFDFLKPVRIVYDGDVIEDIREFNPYNQRSINVLTKASIYLFSKGNRLKDEFRDAVFLTWNVSLNVDKKIDIKMEMDGEINFDFVPVPSFYSLQKTIEVIEDLRSSGFRIIFVGEEDVEVEKINGLIKENFLLKEKKIAVVGRKRKKAFVPFRSISFSLLEEITSYSELKKGDFVVHRDFGIGRFKGLTTIKTKEGIKDFMLIEYEMGDKLFVPIEKIDRGKKYLGDESSIKLTRLGGNEWNRAVKRAKKDAERIARELVALYAKREISKKRPFKAAYELEKEFALSFPFKETPDQKRAIDEVLKDLESTRLMDRVVTGDVGYGKTEVALRAALRVIVNGKQVAFLTPTTILSMQHFEVAKERFASLPIRVEMISRFIPKSKQKSILRDLRNGKIDLIIGTHRLLSNDVRFFDLGLLIVDEEHLFGVEHKEKIKKMKTDVDVIYLTATPIPRTLEMILSGIREVSLIKTPPPGKQPIETTVEPFNVKRIKEAIEFELSRGGQVYYVHNKIITIEEEKAFLNSLVPNAKILVLHGALDSKDIEEGMMKFINREYDILLSTTIIEAGLDNENVNTLIVVDSQNFGLAQLYQLRGRIGRRDKKAYAHFFYTPYKVTEKGRERLKAIKELTHLGAGFQIAMRDLEIRGAGNILGKEQSGHINALGFDMYAELLSEEIEKIKKKKPLKIKFFTEIDLKLPAIIPKTYIEDESERLHIYRKFYESYSIKDVERVVEEVIDRFGPMPEQMNNLVEISKINVKMKRYRIKAINFDNGKLYIKPSKDTPIDKITIIK